jgi:tRNA-specific 2-thiouridylase
MKIALSLGADFVATGHCVKKVKPKLMEKRFINLKQVQILIKINLLCQLSQEQLAKLFPMGYQPEVREIATEMELITAERKIRKVCVLLEKPVF